MHQLVETAPLRPATHAVGPYLGPGPVVVYAFNPLNPYERKVFRARPGQTLNELRPVTPLPVMCVLNGEPVLPEDWEYVPSVEDHVGYIVLPQGGGGDGGSNPVVTILGIIVTVVGALTYNPYLIAAGIAMLAMGLIPAPTFTPISPPPAANAELSPTYNIQLAGNSARLGQAIPVVYGLHVLMPDFAGQPYSEFDAVGDQYYHAILCLGMATDFVIKSVMIDDTVLSHFEGVEQQLYGPGGQPTLTLVNPCVVNAPEIAQQDLEYGTVVGPFASCGPGLRAVKIGIDVVFPRGLYFASDTGELQPKSVSWLFEARAISDSGAVAGNWFLLGLETFEDASNKAIRRTYTYDVPPGRYEVRGQRTTERDDNTRAGHDIQWLGMRAYLNSPAELDPEATYLALRIKANNQLSGLSQRRISVILQRKLPTWTPFAPGDANWLDVVLHLEMNGPNASTTFTDTSPTPKTVTAAGPAGAAQLTTAEVRYATASAHFTLPGARLEIDSAPLSVGTDEFDLRTWFYAVPTAVERVIYDCRDSVAGSAGFVWFITTAGKLAYAGGSPYVTKVTSVSIPTNAWSFLRLARISGRVYAQVNTTVEDLGADVRDLGRSAGGVCLDGPLVNTLVLTLRNGYDGDQGVANGGEFFVTGFIDPPNPSATDIVYLYDNDLHSLPSGTLIDSLTFDEIRGNEFVSIDFYIGLEAGEGATLSNVVNGSYGGACSCRITTSFGRIYDLSLDAAVLTGRAHAARIDTRCLAAGAKTTIGSAVDGSKTLNEFEFVGPFQLTVGTGRGTSAVPGVPVPTGPYPTDASIGGWSAPVETSSIAWAIVDALKNPTYGGGVDDSRIDLMTFYELDLLWKSRYDEFNGVFDKRTTLWSAIATIARAGRARPLMRGSVFTCVRDSQQELPVAMFGMRNIKRGSFSIDYVLVTEDDPDSIELEFFDARTWSANYVTMPIDPAVTAETAVKPMRMSIVGITGMKQAQREAAYYAAGARYRRSSIVFTTEMEGFLPGFGDLIGVGHDVTGWGSSGELVAWDGEIAECSEELTWSVGDHYAMLVDEQGDPAGPFKVVQGPTANSMRFVESPGDVPYVGTERERTRYAMGPGANYFKLCRVVSISPQGNNEVEIRAIVEDNRVHAADALYAGPSTGTAGGGPRTARYAPSGVPNYNAASTEQRNAYGFYSTAERTVGTVNDPAYVYAPS